MDEDGTVIVADLFKHRIVEWKRRAPSGTVLAGGNGEGSRPDQLNSPTDVIVDKETDSLIIFCWGSAMDDGGSFYVTEVTNDEVRCYC